MNVSQCTPVGVKTSNLRIDYKPVASLSGLRVFNASLPCLEYAHSYYILGLLSAHFRIVLDHLQVIRHPRWHDPSVGSVGYIGSAGAFMRKTNWLRPDRESNHLLAKWEIKNKTGAIRPRFSFEDWQEREDSNPRPLVLESNGICLNPYR